jgi:transcriptional regulator with XRE-family HTH domain
MTDVLKKAIAETGVSHAELERETGVTRASIMRFMRGETSLRLDIADKLATYLDVEVSWRKGKR